MPALPDDDALRRLRLHAQRLVPGAQAADVREAVRAVVGVQAQDLRAAALALRSRVPGLVRSAVGGAGLVRTWTLRGTVHLLAEDDLPWLHALTGPRNRRRFEGLLAKRGDLDRARAMLPDLVAVLEEAPRDRAALLAALAARGHAPLSDGGVNMIVPWATSQGVVAGLPDGRLRAADPPPGVDEDEALATLATRYLAGFGPATAADLASWSGLPLGTARRALAAGAPGTEARGDLHARAGAFDAEPPPAPPALLLAAFDTLMLGHRTREPFVAAADDRHVLRGGGMLRPVALAHGRATGTWRLGGRDRRTAEVEWFGPPAPAEAVREEAADIARFLAG